MPPLRKTKELSKSRPSTIERIGALLEVARTMSSVLDLDSLLRMIVTVATEQSDAGKCTIMLIEDEQHLVLKVGVGIDEKKLQNVRTKLGEGIAGLVAQTGEPIWVKNIETDKRFKRKSSVKYQTASFLSVPLVVKNKVIGVLNVNDKRDNEPFSKDDFEMITILASQAAIAIENARLYTHAQQMRIYLQNILDNLIESVIVIDSSQKCTFINSQTFPLLSPVIDSPIGVEYQKVFLAPVVEVLDKVVKATHALGSIIDEEIEIQTGDETSIPVGISGSLLKVNNEPSGVILVARDLTPTRELAKLQVLNQMKSEFISTVSHELRTPLTAIKGSVSLVVDERTGKINDLQKEMLTLVRRNADRLAKMIDELLEMSRSEAGKPMRLARSTFPLRELVSDIVKLFTQQAHQNELKLEMVIPDNLGNINADSAKIHQVIINLVGNAIKFTPAGGTVTISAQENNESWQVTVSDTGIGIPKEELEKVFDTYHQVKHPNLTTHVKGFGLGLAISKRIIEAHKGKIWVESDVGAGSRFIFQLPKQQPAE